MDGSMRRSIDRDGKKRHQNGEQHLSFAKLQTIHFEVVVMMSECPIVIHPTHPDDEPYLCPNHLLLGRASARHQLDHVENGSQTKIFTGVIYR